MSPVEGTSLPDDAIDLARLWREAKDLARQYGRRILLLGCITGFLMGVVTLTLLSRRWEATASFFLGPIPTSAGSSSLQRMLATVTGSTAVSTNVLPNELALQILDSRTFAEKAIERFQLLPLLGAESLQEGVRALQGSPLGLALGEEGMLSVSIRLPGTPRVQRLGDLVSGEEAMRRDLGVRQLSADLANYYVQLFDDFMQARAVDEINAYAQSARQALVQASEDLARARAEWAAFQLEQEELPALPDSAKQLVEKLVTLEKQKAVATINLRAQESEGAGGYVVPAEDAAPASEATSPVLGTLNQQLAQVEIEIQEQSQKLGPEHPALLQLQDRYLALEQEIKDEQRRVLETGRERLYALDREIDKVLSQLRDFTQTQGLYRQTELNLRIAEEIYQAVSVQLKQAEMEAGGRGLRLRIVDPAIAPDKKVRPSSVRNGLIGLILGWGLGAGWVMARRLKQRLAVLLE